MNFSNACLGKLVCGACERELPDDSYSGEQRGLRESSRRCEECVASENQLVLMKKGRTRSEDDDCPICQLPLPLDSRQSSFQLCCMTMLCDGCVLASQRRGMDDCPFCRTPKPDADADGAEALAMVQNRVDAGDPLAMFFLGVQCESGGLDLEKKDVARAVDLFERASELGEKRADYNLACLYSQGTGVDRDAARAIRHYEAAAMRGHVFARFNLGLLEQQAENYDVALQHWMIAASLGHQGALDEIKDMFEYDLATKAEYAEALRGYHGAVKEMRSPDRDEASAA